MPSKPYKELLYEQLQDREMAIEYLRLATPPTTCWPEDLDELWPVFLLACKHVIEAHAKESE